MLGPTGAKVATNQVIPIPLHNVFILGNPNYMRSLVKLANTGATIGKCVDIVTHARTTIDQLED